VRAPDLVSDAMEDRLAQVGLKRTIVLRLEGIEVTDRANEDVLHDVVGVHRVAGPAREAPAGPKAHGLDLPLQKLVQRLLVTVSVPT